LRRDPKAPLCGNDKAHSGLRPSNFFLICSFVGHPCQAQVFFVLACREVGFCRTAARVFCLPPVQSSRLHAALEWASGRRPSNFSRRHRAIWSSDNSRAFNVLLESSDPTPLRSFEVIGPAFAAAVVRSVSGCSPTVSHRRVTAIPRHGLSRPPRFVGGCLLAPSALSAQIEATGFQPRPLVPQQVQAWLSIGVALGLRIYIGLPCGGLKLFFGLHLAVGLIPEKPAGSSNAQSTLPLSLRMQHATFGCCLDHRWSIFGAVFEVRTAQCHALALASALRRIARGGKRWRLRHCCRPPVAGCCCAWPGERDGDSPFVLRVRSPHRRLHLAALTSPRMSHLSLAQE